MPSLRKILPLLVDVDLETGQPVKVGFIDEKNQQAVKNIYLRAESTLALAHLIHFCLVRHTNSEAHSAAVHANLLSSG